MAGRYRGVTKRGQGWQIAFTLPDGTRCREVVRLPQTRKGEDEANGIRCRVVADIDRGSFDYAEYFPRSRKAIEYSIEPGRHIRIEECLKDFLIRKKPYLADSTYRNYECRTYAHLVPVFGRTTLAELTANDVRKWMQTVGLTAKSINNILIPLREVYSEAYQRELIDKNPLDRVASLPVTRAEPDPLSEAEIAAVLSEIAKISNSALQYFRFAFGTGLRTSELLALEWSDIDLVKRQVHVCKAVVDGRRKNPKTTRSNRSVDLQPLAALAISELSVPRDLSRRLFVDDRTGKPWRGDQSLRKGIWYPALQAAGVRLRTAYQTRHTYASHLLSGGANPLYVAQQMGHRDWGMIRMVYGRYIGGDAQ